MIVTDIRRIDDKRYCLYIDYEPYASVYSSDIRRLQLRVGEEVDEVSIKEFRKEYLFRRALNKAVNSIKFSGGSYMKQGRSTTQAERIQIVKDCLASGKNYGEMALKYKVSYQQVRTWTLRFDEMGEAGLEDRRGKRKKDQAPRTELEKAQIEIEQLKHKLYLAEMERDLLKKLDEIERRDAFRK